MEFVHRPGWTKQEKLKPTAESKLRTLARGFFCLIDTGPSEENSRLCLILCYDFLEEDQHEKAYTDRRPTDR